MMSEESTPPENDELLDAIYELFDGIVPEAPEEVDAFLVESGYSPDELDEKFKALAAHALDRSPYDWRNRARAKMEKDKERLALLKQEVPEGKSNLLRAIQELLEVSSIKSQGKLRLAHRNFEELTENDLATLYLDLKFLQDESESEDENISNNA